MGSSENTRPAHSTVDEVEHLESWHNTSWFGSRRLISLWRYVNQTGCSLCQGLITSLLLTHSLTVRALAVTNAEWKTYILFAYGWLLCKTVKRYTFLEHSHEAASLNQTVGLSRSLLTMLTGSGYAGSQVEAFCITCYLIVFLTGDAEGWS